MYKIPDDEQNNVMENFWTMLRECEASAEARQDAVLMRWVEEWYQLWNRITGDNLKPQWAE